MATDEETSVDQLNLVVCVQSKFKEVNVFEMQEEQVHEDWEPDAEFKAHADALNKYLREANTKTWFPGNTRINLLDYYQK